MAILTWGVREREIVREGSWGCWVFWTNPGLSQAQDAESGFERKAEIKSALLTADWQFQRAIEKERCVVEDVEIERRLAGLR